MAILTNIMRRFFCAECGKGLIIGEPDVKTENIKEWLMSEMTSRGWKALGHRLWICGDHVAGYENATEDELHFLRDKLWAHRTAYEWTLEFYIHGGRVITETGTRSATSQELEMWRVLRCETKKEHR
jgi:hypothetical protein